ncbi:MAG: flippase-like domain-containing protein [Akkermansiaceae bacterium]|nr:flippase-like domain-containing protein [Armatimonadota bacterium]
MTDSVTNETTTPVTAVKPQIGWGRIALFAGLFLIVIAVIYSRQKEALEVWNTLRAGNPGLIAAAMAVQVVYWTTFAAMYQTSYRVVGLQSRVRDLLPVWLGSLFVSIAAPAAAPAVFMDDAVRRGQSPAKVAAGILVLRLTDFGTLTVFIAFGIATMATRMNVHPWQSATLLGHCVALLILVGVTLAWSGPLFLARWRPQALRGVLNTVRNAVNGTFRLLRRPEPLTIGGDHDWATHHAEQFSHSADLALANPIRLVAPAAVATLAHLLDWASLHIMLHAFGIDADLGTSLIAFSACLLYWIVSPTPDGVGFVEAAVALSLVTIGVAKQPEAIAAAIAFRGITLYLPVLLGGICLPRLAAGKGTG